MATLADPPVVRVLGEAGPVPVDPDVVDGVPAHEGHGRLQVDKLHGQRLQEGVVDDLWGEESIKNYRHEVRLYKVKSYSKLRLCDSSSKVGI